MKPLAFSGVLLVNVLLGVFIGYKIDEFLHTTPIFILIGVGYSVFGSMYLLVHKAGNHE